VVSVLLFLSRFDGAKSVPSLLSCLLIVVPLPVCIKEEERSVIQFLLSGVSGAAFHQGHSAQYDNCDLSSENSSLM
jgi:hypothetical protein